MAILIQKLKNVVNVIETTRLAGEQIINSLGVDCVAKVQHKDPYSDQINIMDTDGKPTQVIKFDGTVEVQDLGGVPAVFVGTIDDLVNKLNNEYFDNASTAVISLTKSKLETLKTEANDLVTTISYLNAADPVNRRVDTIVYSSVILGLSATETYAYGGAAGDYYITSITVS